MILTAGLTPAWQQILVLDSLEVGQVNRAKEVHWCASGKVLNAGIAAHRLGGASLTLATAGGSTLAELDRDLDSLGVPRRWVVTRSATRICTTLLDQRTGAITELVETGRPVLPEELEAFRRAYAEEAAKADVAVILGSLPAGTPVSLYRELVERTPCPVVLDFRGDGLVSLLDLKPFLVKPNREELGHTFGRPLTTDAELGEAMQSLNARGAQWVVVTQGSGPVWATSASHTYRLKPPPVSWVVNPIASGDAMAAGIAWATRQGHSPLDAIRLGMAAAAQNLQDLLPCRLDAATVEQIAQTIRVEEVF